MLALLEKDTFQVLTKTAVRLALIEIGEQNPQVAKDAFQRLKQSKYALDDPEGQFS